MSARRLLTYLLLLSSPALAFGWNHFPALSTYTPQLVALIVILYLAFQLLTKGSTVGLYLLSLAICLIILATGGISSPVFFLAYFLLFAVAFLAQPLLAILLATVIALCLLLSLTSPFSTAVLPIASLFLISPLAMLFGSQYIKLNQDEAKIKVLESQEAQLEKEVDLLLEKYAD